MVEPSIPELDALSALHREQVKLCEEIGNIGKGDSHPDAGVLQKLEVLKAMIAHNEASAVEAPRRGGNSRDGVTRASSAMEIDGSADSPAPSPMVDKPLRKGERGGASRNSLPPKEIPKDTHAKQESVESTVPTPSVEVNPKGKITFAMGAEVAFRPKQTGAEEPEWIQGVVVKIIGEGKSRRYDVQDPEPDEVTKKPGQVYRTSASSMVTIPPLGQPLADYPKGKAVLARYPDTTTFYRAEVVGMNGSMVNLKFEGEEDAQVTMEVDRRFVLDHRG
jgi:SAGA-associated factor 29